VIIALTGLNAAGKDTVADMLVERGFKKYSCSDIIRDECRKNDIELTRENLITRGNLLREKYGTAYLGEQIAKKIKEENQGNVVVSSIRHPAEYIPLKEVDHLKLIYIHAPIKLRFDRVQKRGRETDHVDFDTFNRLEEIELSGEGSQQQISKVIEAADITVNNDSDFDELRKRLVKAIGWSRFAKSRDPWDVYFMKIARQVSTRSTCDRLHVGAVLVKDKTILSTGYNGSIRGMPHCDEVGHMMKDGSCVATIHAEANAIIQSAKNGVTIDGADLYVTYSPCWKCFKMIVNSGIKRVFYGTFYRDAHIEKVSQELGVQFKQVTID